MKNDKKRVLFMVSNKRDHIKDSTVRNLKNEKMFNVSWDFYQSRSSINISNINKEKVKSIDSVYVKKVDVDSNLFKLKENIKDLHFVVSNTKPSYRVSFPIDFKDYEKHKDMYIIIINYTILPLTVGKAN